ncbi:hypothetical protein SA2016_0994 [Sinomonas atrocyanea]|uniref:Integrase n=1 Tax=Sinomonas atrocyanea TaxID=37927 RepID=A0A126ZWW2_9MICC|nr:tyrosine-type recombinase/integrase [Sinomonas atrocyanea]AMM31679.1 hypothetical protein SA2016_0994 [Sinomonas atrocyanea]GEB65332.1 site-specific integrase [Sinomonas atrocyanea]GGG59156.1 site-specific integrase [Sinomonas atrocyanea]
MAGQRRGKKTGSISKASDGWKGYVTVDGQRKYFWAKTRREADLKRRHLVEHPEDVRNERAAQQEAVEPHPPTRNVAVFGSSTVGAIVSGWIDHKLKVERGRHKPKTSRGYSDHLRIHVNHPEYGIGDLDADEVTAEGLEDFFTALREEALLGASARRGIHSLLNSAFNFALERRMVRANPVPRYLRPAPHDGEIVEIDPAQVEQLLLHFAFDSTYEARWLLALFVGLRPGEALAIQVEDIDWNKGLLRVYQQLQQDSGSGGLILVPVKSRTSKRTLVLPDFVLEALKARRAALIEQQRAAGEAWNPWRGTGEQAPQFLFVQDNGQPIRPRLDYAIWKRLLEVAGVVREGVRDGVPVLEAVPVSRYACRHHAATWLLGIGNDVALVSRYLGHSDVGFTMRTYVSSRLSNASVAVRMEQAFPTYSDSEIVQVATSPAPAAAPPPIPPPISARSATPPGRRGRGSR